MKYKGSFNSDKFIKFLKKLHEDGRRKTFMLDGHTIYKIKKVNEYLNSINNEIKIYFIPGYSLELNPDEQVWN